MADNQATASAMTLFEKLLCVEFGYKQCQKGANLQKALVEARKILAGSEKSFQRANGVQGKPATGTANKSAKTPAGIQEVKE